MSSTIIIHGVLSKYIDIVFNDIKQYIENALVKTNAFISCEEIYEELKEAKNQLWLLIIKNKIVGCCVTNIQEYRHHKVLEVVTIGVEKNSEYKIQDWLPAFEQTITDYAVYNNCTDMMQVGRSGWLKTLNKTGWVKSLTYMVKKLD